MHSPQLKYLHIALKNGGEATSQAFHSMQPNNQQLGDAHAGGQLVGVIVSLQGEATLEFAV